MEFARLGHVPLAVARGLDINAAQVWTELQQLADFSDASAPAVTRVVFTKTDLRAREYVKSLCTAAGLETREDAVGNTFARWAADTTLPAIGTGSHIDAIPNAGRFDGTVGVLGGLEAIRALQRAGFRPSRSIELLIFTSEEPTRFGVGCLGSRLLSGVLDASCGVRFRDEGGNTLNDVRQNAGFSGSLDTVKLPPDYYSAFIELHIEQGPLLERDGIPIGIVTAIAAPASLHLSVEGEGGHAGAVLMDQRRDALPAAAEMILAIEDAAKSTGSRDTVATAGLCEVFPGAINSIPSRVRLGVDVRDIDGPRRDRVLGVIEDECGTIASRRGVQVESTVLNIDDPGKCDGTIIGAVESSCVGQGIGFMHMISRAYHDSLFMSRIAPAAMIFIPCRGGVSHRPDEYADPESIAAGIAVLAGTLARLAA